jgi:hypothetical protein
MFVLRDNSPAGGPILVKFGTHLQHTKETLVFGTQGSSTLVGTELYQG